jgi:hypothetical protein
MAALQRAETIPNISGTPTLSSKPLPGSSSLGQKVGKPVVPTAPRIDYEPLYTALKAGIGANWHLYGESIGLYCRGMCRFVYFSMDLGFREVQKRLYTMLTFTRPTKPSRAIPQNRPLPPLGSAPSTYP